MQTAMVANDTPLANIVQVVNEMLKDITAEQKDKIVTDLLSTLAQGKLDADDVQAMLKFDTTLEAVGTSLTGIRQKIDESCLAEAVKEMLEANAGVTPEVMAKAVLLQKLMGSLGLSPVDTAKMAHLQKTMYNAGASPQDIAMVLNLVTDNMQQQGSDLLAGLTNISKESLNESDINLTTDLIDSFRGTKASPELTSKIILLQKAIESGIKSPENLAEELSQRMKDQDANPADLVEPLQQVLQQNGLTTDHLECVALMQKAAEAAGLSPKDFAVVMQIQKALVEAGVSPETIATAIESLLKEGQISVGSAAEAMVTALDHNR